MLGIARVGTAVVLLATGGPQVFADDAASGTAQNCSFQAEPDRFLGAEARARRQVTDNLKFRDRLAARTVKAAEVPRKNFIDEEIFGKMAEAGVAAAPLATDEEFFRRIYLDLTGRLPAPGDVRAFLADEAADKRDKVIDRLLNSPEFVDKWAVWMGDWFKNAASVSTSNSPQQLQGRNAFYRYIWSAINERRSLHDVALEMIYGYGNNYDEKSGYANFLSSATAAGGPIQDTFDAMLVKSATTFLGLGNYDCLLCHNGRGHLDQLNLWGRNTTRLEAQKMAAHFARTLTTRWPNPPGLTTAELQALPYYNSYTVEDHATRTYDLNTTYGNRPNRVAVNGLSKLTPEYRGGAKMTGASWRASFAENMVNDPMFARNIVNRVWKQLFNQALAEPMDGLDPARLDPANPPPDGWAFQATHPELLEKLAGEFRLSWYDLRWIIKKMVESNAYQLSSRYDGEWSVEYVSLYARHFPRRLDGEEVHDAIAKSTGVFANYTQTGAPEPVKWAMQLYDPVEPRSNGTAANFMNYFLRGNRDTTVRSQAGTLQQQLALMNDSFVIGKIKMNNSPALQGIAKLGTNEAMVEEMFLNYLARLPDAWERERALSYLKKGGTAAQRNTVLEDLAWSLINKVDFLYSY